MPPTRIVDIPTFLTELAALLALIDQCRAVLFRSAIREDVHNAIGNSLEAFPALRDLREIYYPAEFENMRSAGFTDAQLNFKLKSFEESLFTFEADGGDIALEDVLDRAEIILSSLAGAIPGFGSFLKEMVSFLSKELKRRMRWWR
jgi:hypothetical protein